MSKFNNREIWKGEHGTVQYAISDFPACCGLAIMSEMYFNLSEEKINEVRKELRTPKLEDYIPLYEEFYRFITNNEDYWDKDKDTYIDKSKHWWRVNHILIADRTDGYRFGHNAGFAQYMDLKKYEEFHNPKTDNPIKLWVVEREALISEDGSLFTSTFRDPLTKRVRPKEELKAIAAKEEAERKKKDKKEAETVKKPQTGQSTMDTFNTTQTQVHDPVAPLQEMQTRLIHLREAQIHLQRRLAANQQHGFHGTARGIERDLRQVTRDIQSTTMNIQEFNRRAQLEQERYTVSNPWSGLFG